MNNSIPNQTLSPPPSPTKISPNVLLIIVVFAFIFFISSILHLLVRFLMSPIARDPDDPDEGTAFQGQLQQLFHLHDSGVDQSFIDTLPLFLYKAIIGLKDPFDCAVCLCEFEPDDKLRLLPKCSHAFHIDCIDTWLLSHSTCPLCRSSLLNDYALESGGESSRDIVMRDNIAFVPDEDDHEFVPPVGENTKEDVGSSPIEEALETRVVQVKLGKFRSSSVGESEGNSSSMRRCFSLGSYEYVMNETTSLQVAIKPPKKKPANSRVSQSREIGGSARISISKKESISVSKIWLRSKNGKRVSEDGSGRAFSFRLPFNQEAGGKAKPRASVSPESVKGLDVEAGSCNDESQIEKTPSFARRTLLWIVGRQSKVESHS